MRAPRLRVLRAALDANVYVSAYVRREGRSGQIIERSLRDLAFEVVLSTEIAEEVLQALPYPKIRKMVRSKIDPAMWFEDIRVLSQFVAAEYKTPGVSGDANDDRYVTAAIEARAAFVVSGDRDLLDVGEHEGVRLLTPPQFLDVQTCVSPTPRQSCWPRPASILT